LESEVLNYIEAMDRGPSLIKEKPIGLNVVEETHTILMHGVRGSKKRPGQLRKEQNWIAETSLMAEIEDARYVPPRSRLRPSRRPARQVSDIL